MKRNWISRLFHRAQRPINRKPQQRIPLRLEVLEARCVLSPIATFSNSGPVNEGSPAKVTFSKASDSPAEKAAGFHYSYGLTTNALAASYASAITSATQNFTFGDNGTYTVYGRIFDKDNPFTDYTTQVKVNNVAPTAKLTSNGPGSMGSPVTVFFVNPSDPSSADTQAGFHYSIVLRYTLKTNPLATTYAAAGTSSSASFTLNSAGIWTIYGRIFDKDNGFRTYVTSVMVRNAPTATLTNNDPVAAGVAVAVTFSNATDPTPAYVTAGFHYSFALSPSGLVKSYAAAGTSTSSSFTFKNSGTYTIYGSIFDKGNRSTTYSSQAIVDDVPPTATLSNKGPGNANSPVTVSFSNASDVSPADTQAGFHYSFARSKGALATSYAAAGTSTSANFTFDTSGSYTVYGAVFDKNNGFTTYSTQVTVNNAASLTISPTSLSNATANSAYSATANATGGAGTYSFAVSAGSLPSWLSLNASTGVLSGTPTTTGSSSFTITATDSQTSSLTGSQTYTLTVNAASSLTVSPASLANATANSAYSATVSATGGSGTYTFAVGSGSLPSWLSLNAATGVLSGTPTTTGSSSFTIKATDSKNHSLTGSQVCTLTVNAASSLTVNPTGLSNAIANSAYSATVIATGGSGTYTFAVSSGSLPSWLSLNAATGVLSGTPTTTGSSSFTIQATDSNISGLTGTQAYTLTVNAASSLTVGPSSLSNATANSAYSATVSATGGSGTYTFAVSSGSLPSWLSLNSATGVLSGTPTTTGSASFAIKATDSNISGLTGSKSYTLTVNAASSLTVSPVSMSSASANVPYSVTVSATGGSGTYTFAVSSGSLPSGLSLNANTGVLSGTPTIGGSYSFTIKASDSKISGLTGTQGYTLAVGGTVFDSNPYITTPYLSIPNFGAQPNIVSVKNGNWSDPTIWSLGRVPKAGDIVDINPGTTVSYDVNDVNAAATLKTLEIQATGTLTFRTDINTQVVVGNFLVLDGGTLQVGTPANPIAANVVANIVIANQAINTSTDPSQFGTGLIVLGNVTMHGAVKTPYVTLAQEAHAGDTALHLASPVTGWQAGDDPLLPDTRQLFQGTTTGSSYKPQWERMTIQSVSADGLTVYLTAPLKYDHLGARDANGVLNYLPQAMNDNRNIMVASQNFAGTRGYTLYTNRANVDLEYAGFCELGRTTNNQPSSSNVADRYAMTMLDLIGPTTPQANGYQFTLIGCEVDNDGDGNPNNPSNIQWGIAVNNSFYGLIQSNTVFAVAGVGIGVEDGAASYNRFDSNFVANVTGSGSRLQDQLQGDGYWFHNPNNYVTNNIATDINASGYDVYSYGFSVSATAGDAFAVGTVTVPASQGADPSQAGQSKSIDMNATPLLQFSGNEVYGATSRGFATWWLGTKFETPQGSAGTLKNSVVWNQFNAGYFTYETNNLVIDGFVARGDASQLNNPYISTVGLYFGDYMTRNAMVENLDIQDELTGVVVPVNVGRGGASDVVTFTIQNAYLRNITNIGVPLLFSSNGGSGLSARTVVIRNVLFAAPTAPLPSGSQSWNISMDTNMNGNPNFYNTTSNTVVDVYNYNDVTGDNFQVFRSNSHPAGATQRAGIDGYVEPL